MRKSTCLVYKGFELCQTDFLCDFYTKKRKKEKKNYTLQARTSLLGALPEIESILQSNLHRHPAQYSPLRFFKKMDQILTISSTLNNLKLNNEIKICTRKVTMFSSLSEDAVYTIFNHP
ncbi:MAG: hypothetical protein EXX96DRAFT_564429 [Benjaminiella poitrasii]|nr:MAG: hypothetical protein EXX96DRAFT_564429 [Benjaminiella poitrasii]